MLSNKYCFIQEKSLLKNWEKLYKVNIALINVFKQERKLRVK